MTLSLELVPGRDRRAAAIWQELAATTPSYFLTWGWMATWLAMMPRGHESELAVVRNGKPVAAAFLNRRRQLRHGVLPSRQRHLNATGIARFDELCIEHNAIVGDASLATVLQLLPEDWDELILPGIQREVLTRDERWRWIVDRESVAPYVDLARVRAKDYVSLLGSSTRAQLRRARRNAGPLTIERATTRDSAMDIFEEMIRLHTNRWQERGQPGAFADPWFAAFHRRLISDRIATGEIELLRIRAGARVVGCLYNFVWRGRVTFYQSGLAAPADHHDKPGYLCHAAAIEQAAAAGHAIYDFMSSSDRYKQNLGTDECRLVWARIQQPLTRFAVEDTVRAWRRRLRQTLATARPID